MDQLEGNKLILKGRTRVNSLSENVIRREKTTGSPSHGVVESLPSPTRLKTNSVPALKRSLFMKKEKCDMAEFQDVDLTTEDEKPPRMARNISKLFASISLLETRLEFLQKDLLALCANLEFLRSESLTQRVSEEKEKEKNASLEKKLNSMETKQALLSSDYERRLTELHSLSLDQEVKKYKSGSDKYRSDDISINVGGRLEDLKGEEVSSLKKSSSTLEEANRLPTATTNKHWIPTNNSIFSPFLH